MTVTVTYVVYDTPGNSITGTFDPLAPAVPFVRTMIADTGKWNLEKYASAVRQLGIVEDTHEGPRWIAPHCIQQIQEERQ